MKRPGGLAVLAAVATGCSMPSGPVVVEDAAPPRIGPQLVVEVRNERNVPVMLLVEFESPNATGGAEGPAEPCWDSPWVQEISGRYRLVVDGDEVLTGVVPPGVDAGDQAVVRLVLDARGDVRVGGLVWRAAEQLRFPRQIPGCG